MHPSLELVFSHLAGGLLWLSTDGRLKYANAQGTRLTGLRAGQALAEGPLKKAVAAIGGGRHPGPIEMEYLPPEGERRLLHAKAAPGLVAGDVFVFLGEAAPHGDQLALDNLMTVIRTDLAPPLDRLQRGLAQFMDGAGDRASVEHAATDAQGIVDTLRRLVDLSSLWSSDSLLASDRIEIWSVLQQAWAQDRPLAEGRRLTVRLINHIAEDALPVTYGSDFWLRRVVTESLQAALRAARPGATVDIELRAMGPRVLIVFRNSGMWPAAARDAVTLSGAGARAARAGAVATGALPAARDQIGLHLCERIVRLHGGLLREESDADGTRNLLIDLPVGAPGRDAHDGHMDAAQAQRYAADLSALMARRRPARPAA